MLDWLPSWRWLPVLLLTFILRAVRPPSFIPKKLSSINPFTAAYWKNTAPEFAFKAVESYVYVYFITLLFPDDYPTYFVQLSRLYRELSYIELPLILGGALPLAALLFIHHLIYRSARPVTVAVALTLEQLSRFLAFAGGSVLLANLVYVELAANLYVVIERPAWVPTWILWLQIVLTVPLAPYFLAEAGYVFGLCLSTGFAFLRSCSTLLQVSSVYVLGNRSMFVKSHPQSVNFPADAGSLRSGDPEETRLLLVSDLHVVPEGQWAMLSEASSEETLTRLSDFARQTSPTALVLVGDITDTGHAKAWNRVAMATARISVPIYAIPGNHDVHFAKYNDLYHGPSYTMQEIENCLKQVANCDEARSSFPQVARPGGRNVLLILFDSNGRESGGPITNALGLVGARQLEQAEVKLKGTRREGDVIVMALHHHVLLPSGGPGIWYLRCLDSAAVLNFAERNGVAAIISGHLHMPFVARYRPQGQNGGRAEILIISCGSLHHRAEGPLAEEVKLPSAYLLTVSNERSIRVSLVSDEVLKREDHVMLAPGDTTMEVAPSPRPDPPQGSVA